MDGMLHEDCLGKRTYSTKLDVKVLTPKHLKLPVLPQVKGAEIFTRWRYDLPGNARKPSSLSYNPNSIEWIFLNPQHLIRSLSSLFDVLVAASWAR